MKKVVGILVILFTAAYLPAVSAEEKPAIAIIDTAIDTNVVKVFHEVCVMQEKRCPNKQTFMEGPGSATLPASQLYKNGFHHGTVMASIAASINPNMNIIFVRIVPMANNGRQGFYGENDLNGAFQWVLANKSRFNIVAISASLGSHNFKSMTNYCPVREYLRKSITDLKNLEVATILAAGNNYDKQRVDFPACISESIAVGSIGERGNIENYSNGGPDLDFYSLGTYDTALGRAMGTSAATAAFAAYWAKNYKGTYQSTHDNIKSLSKDLVVSVK